MKKEAHRFDRIRNQEEKEEKKRAYNNTNNNRKKKPIDELKKNEK